MNIWTPPVDMISRLDTQTPQVLIETRIVEVNEVNIPAVGIQWGIDSSWSAATGNPTGLRFQAVSALPVEQMTSKGARKVSRLILTSS